MDELTKRFIDSYDYLKAHGYVSGKADFAVKISTSSSMMTEITNGRSNPGGKLLQNTVKEFPIDATWLLTGNGEMVKKASNYADTPHAKTHAADTEMVYNAETPTAKKDVTTVKSKKVDPPSDPPRKRFSPEYITVNSEGAENILFIPVRAAAGYLNGYQDREYIEQLTSFNLPQLKNATFRAFEVDGDSMSPTLDNKETVVGKYLQSLEDIKEDFVHVIVTKNRGVIVKRVLNRIKQYGYIIAKSDAFDNRNSYPNIEIYPDEIVEIWLGVAHINFKFKHPTDMYKRVNNMEAELTEVMRILKKSNLMQ